MRGEFAKTSRGSRPRLAGGIQCCRATTNSVSDSSTSRAAWSTGNPAEALANAVPYMQAFGHTVIAWMWLDVALCALQKGSATATGKIGAMTYFFHYELPKIGAWLNVVESRDPVCAQLPEDAF